jgi:L-ascorbate metabolism protein UlaG (beta-lactamase superfamily)
MELTRRRWLKLGGVVSVVLVAGACATHSATGPAPTVTMPGGKVEVLWLGQSATRITSPGGKVIVLDPFLKGNRTTPAEWKDLSKLGKVDLILVTHGHGDHIGDVKELAAMTGAPVYGPAGLMQTLVDLGWIAPDKAVRFGKGGRVTPLGPGITITQVRAEHSSEVTITDPATKKSTTHPGGEPCGFVIELENGFRIYHMGDTGLFGDMRLIARYYRPDLIMIPIGGHFVMDPRDAAYATREMLRPAYAIPFHYATNDFLKGTPQEYMQFLGQTSTRVLPLKQGEKVTLPM